MTHHTVKIDAIKAQRDKLFDEYWETQARACDAPRDHSFMRICREVAEHAFHKGFFHGLVIGAEHGAKLAGAAIASDVQDILSTPEEEH